MSKISFTRRRFGTHGLTPLLTVPGAVCLYLFLQSPVSVWAPLWLLLSIGSLARVFGKEMTEIDTERRTIAVYYWFLRSFFRSEKNFPVMDYVLVRELHEDMSALGSASGLYEISLVSPAKRKTILVYRKNSQEAIALLLEMGAVFEARIVDGTKRKIVPVQYLLKGV